MRSKPAPASVATLGVALAILMSIGTAAPSTALPPGDMGPATAPASAVSSDGAFLTGKFTPNHFGLDQGGNLLATGTVIGKISKAGAMQFQVDQQITLPVDRQPSSGSCRMVDVAVGPQDLTVGGVPMHMDQEFINISMPQEPGTGLLMPLCDAGELMKGPPAQTNPGLRDDLNQMLSQLGQGG